MSSERPEFFLTLRAFDEGLKNGWHLGAQFYVSLRGKTQISVPIGQRAPGERMQNSDLLLWLSAGKPLTAIGVAQLLEQHGILETSPVCELIPEFGVRGKEHITLHHLFTHMGGFRDADQLDENLPWATMMSAICATPLEKDWILGQKAAYHTASSWYLLGEMIQKLSGQSFAEYIQNHVARPLGMSRTFLELSPSECSEPANALGLLYNTFAGKQQPHSSWNSPDYCQRPRPGSNVRGPIRDLGCFYESLLGYGPTPSPLPSRAMIARFTTRQRLGFYDHTLQGSIDWGYGFLIQPLVQSTVNPPYTYGSHASAATFGHSGNQCSCAFADPAHGLVVAWICNGRPGERIHQMRANAINNAIYQDLGLI